MYKIVMNLLLFMVVMSGCSVDPSSSVGIDEGSKTLNVNGVSRTIYYRVPDENATDLIIALHGGTDDVSTFEDYTLITDEVRESKHFGVVYPVGINAHWNDGRTESGSTADDVAFMQKIIAEYQNEGFTKFYVVGMSNGGLMAQRLACDIPNAIEGIVVVSATQSTWLKDNCTDNSTPMKTMFIFGDADPIFNDDLSIKPDRGTHIGMTATKEYWLTRNVCSTTMRLDKTKDSVSNDPTSVQFYVGENCLEAFEYLKVVDGGHRWPDPSASNGTIIVTIAGNASHEISTAKEIVKFFGL